MSLAPIFTPAQIEQIYTVLLDPYKLRHSKGNQYRCICPSCGTSNNTKFLVDFSDGHYHCFACRTGGRKSKPYFLVQMVLEQQLGRSPMHDEVQTRIEQILGEPIIKRVHQRAASEVKNGGYDLSQAQAHYVYQDEAGDEVFTTHRLVFRDGSKKVVPDRPCPFCREKVNLEAECPWKCDQGRIQSLTAREDGLPAVRRVIYRLPDLMASTVVFICEGEKNVNDLSRALGAYIKTKTGIEFGPLVLDRIAVVTNVGGANGWKEEYKYGLDFRRKTVIVLRDNDTAGQMHREAVCRDVAPHAREVWTLDLPEMAEGEDISDYLERHTIDQFLALLPTRKLYESPAKKYLLHTKEDEQRVLLIKPSKLMRAGEAHERDWLVPGLIARGKRGLVVAPPKTGKSLLFCDLALCLATNQSFLGGKPYGRPVKCALISREDGPDELYFRLQALGAARGLDWSDIDRNLSVNTEKQSSQFRIDNPQHLSEMAEWLKADGAEFCIIDVMNRIHGAAENSSDEMTKVMQRFDDLAHMSGAQVCVIHHTNKEGGIKGSTSIEAWADYIIRLEPNADDDAIKTLHLRTKSSSSVPPRTLRYSQTDDKKQSRISLVEARPIAVPASSRPRLLTRTGTEHGY